MKRQNVCIAPFSVIVLCMVLVAGCRLLPVTEMSPPLTQLAISNDDISNWNPQEEMKIYIGTQLFAFNDGAAPQYLEKGLIKTGVQTFESLNNNTVNAMIMDFGSDSNAIAMFLEKRTQFAGQTIKDPLYPESVAFQMIVLGGVDGFAHYKNYYFEISATGFSDMAQAVQTFDLFYNLYRKKVDSR
ncbi:MAG: hypothetical protein JXA71_08950 [Chitinispirillaceae bacterium]|nr:hypothetical protein [Chitinispirillaceae bacterium]